VKHGAIRSGKDIMTAQSTAAAAPVTAIRRVARMWRLADWTYTLVSLAIGACAAAWFGPALGLGWRDPFSYIAIAMALMAIAMPIRAIAYAVVRRYGGGYARGKAALTRIAADGTDDVGPLLAYLTSVLPVFDLESWGLAAGALARALPLLDEADARRLSRRDRHSMLVLLKRLTAFLTSVARPEGLSKGEPWTAYDVDLSVAIIAAYRRVFDAEAHARIRRLADTKHAATSHARRVVDAARECLPYIDANRLAQRDKDLLLRPSARDESATLLRPTSSPKDSDTARLLRPAQSAEQADSGTTGQPAAANEDACDAATARQDAS
jgi:hypothetical protein